MRWNKYKNKKRSCPLCKPHKKKGARFFKIKEALKRKQDEKEIREAKKT